LRGTDAHRGVAAALVVDVRDQRLERLAVLGISPQQHVARLDAHVVEGELGLARGAQPHLHVRAGNGDARRPEVDHDRADPLRARALGEAAPHEARDRFVAARHVVLVGVEAEALAVGRQARPHVTDRRARFRLADADAEQPLAARGDRQPAVAQRIGAEMLDRARGTVEDQLGEDRARHVGPGQLLQHDRRFDIAETRAAPSLADRDAEELGLAHRVPRRLRELLGLVALAGHRRERPVRDVACELAQRGLVLGVGERVGAPRDGSRLGRCRCRHERQG
jgi:hypothetical protein